MIAIRRALWVVVVLGVVYTVAGTIGANGPPTNCVVFAQWDRQIGSLAPIPELMLNASGPRERVTLLRCDENIVRVDIEQYEIKLSRGR